jgi:hypothetical protein
MEMHVLIHALHTKNIVAYYIGTGSMTHIIGMLCNDVEDNGISSTRKSRDIAFIYSYNNISGLIPTS